MAEGAHLTSAVSTERPSIFEVLAQESLVATIRPAIKHAVRVLCEVRPGQFGWLLRSYDEMYTGLDLLLQHHYLTKYSATFAENFYNLKRICTHQGTGKLPRRVLWKSLMCVVFVPYLKLKLDEKFEELRHLYNTHAAHTRERLFVRLFVGLYPYIHMVWEGCLLSYQLGYMLHKWAWHSPLLQLAAVTLHSHYTEPEQLLSSSPPWHQQSFRERTTHLASKLLNLTATGLSSGLSLGVFFIQFLDWWYANDSSSTSLTALPVPDPPQQVEVGGAREPGVCPVCHRQRTNDTALASSGYVFCYPCIYDHVSQYKMCPVTRYPASTQQLIKLFIDKS